MTEFELTETARQDLDFECSACGETEVPEVVDREESPNPLVDYRITVSCIACAEESQSDVWERDVRAVDNND